MAWNHNLHYHDIVMGAIPPHCRRALDVGCGRGVLARKLAQECDEVIGIDLDTESLAFAKAAARSVRNIGFLQGDVLEETLAEESFDFIAVVATLHHLPLRNALERFRRLLRGKGVLCVIGLYRSATPIDYAFGAVAWPISWAVRFFKGQADVGAPQRDPAETLRHIRATCSSFLPGGMFNRRLFFRYTFIWQKPG